jgi:hypothetical protein
MIEDVESKIEKIVDEFEQKLEALGDCLISDFKICIVANRSAYVYRYDPTKPDADHSSNLTQITKKELRGYLIEITGAKDWHSFDGQSVFDKIKD